jgi:hypothetical protein
LKSSRAFFVVLFLFLFISVAQNASAQSIERTDVYHVEFLKAALGKAGALADFLKTPNPKSAMPGHFILLRHQEGEDWDYVVIQHLGTKATIEAAGNPPPPGARDLVSWHGDTYVNGPSWPAFVKALGLGDNAAKTSGSVYVVSVFRAAPGHREELEKNLSVAPAAGDTASGAVFLTHLEGAPWAFLTITRYNSWQDFGTSEASGISDSNKGNSGWFTMREHASYHADTIADRIAP